MRAQWLPLVGSLLATACFNPSSSAGTAAQGESHGSETGVGSTSQACAAGDAGCDCYPNATCNDSLVCDPATMLCVPDDCVSATQGCPCIEAQCLPGLMCDGGLCQPGDECHRLEHGRGCRQQQQWRWRVRSRAAPAARR
ncbi:MAG: hypothetical protein IPN32_18010 [Deltaproteobacteria bacterium]|nr:hypothetical protein [Deltaproteobacteria bacterium]